MNVSEFSEPIKMGDTVCLLRASWRLKGIGSDPTLSNENDNKGTEGAAMARFVLLCSPNSSDTKDIVIPPLITR